LNIIGDYQTRRLGNSAGLFVIENKILTYINWQFVLVATIKNKFNTIFDARGVHD